MITEEPRRWLTRTQLDTDAMLPARSKGEG